MLTFETAPLKVYQLLSNLSSRGAAAAANVVGRASIQWTPAPNPRESAKSRKLSSSSPRRTTAIPVEEVPSDRFGGETPPPPPPPGWNAAAPNFAEKNPMESNASRTKRSLFSTEKGRGKTGLLNGIKFERRSTRFSVHLNAKR